MGEIHVGAEAFYFKTMLQEGDGFRSCILDNLEGIPLDTQLKAIGYNGFDGVFDFYLEHPSFPETEEEKKLIERQVKWKFKWEIPPALGYTDSRNETQAKGEPLVESNPDDAPSLTTQPPTSIKPCWMGAETLKTQIELFLLEHGDPAWTTEELKDKAVRILVEMLMEVKSPEENAISKKRCELCLNG